MKTLHLIIVLFAIGSLLTSSGFSDVSAEKGGNDKSQGTPSSCDNGKKKNPEKNPNCVPPLECPPGEHDEGGICVADPIVCEEGFHEEGGICVADPIVCEEGFHEEGGICVADTLVCEEGFHEEGGICVADVEPPSGFTACDTDGDGKITWQELQALGYFVDAGSIDFIEDGALSSNHNTFIDTQDELDFLNGFITPDCI